MSIRRFVAAGVALSLTAPLMGVGSAGAATPADPTVTNARSWLVSQQEADGGLELANTPGFETPDAALALAACHTTPPVNNELVAARQALTQALGLKGGHAGPPLTHGNLVAQLFEEPAARLFGKVGRSSRQVG